jgi:hypothetical protein
VATHAKANTGQCDRGHEFVHLPEGTETVQKGNTTMAVGIGCPDCDRLFDELPTRAKDNAAYLPRHSKAGTDKVPPKEPTAPATVTAA